MRDQYRHAWVGVIGQCRTKARRARDIARLYAGEIDAEFRFDFSRCRHDSIEIHEVYV